MNEKNQIEIMGFFQEYIKDEVLTNYIVPKQQDEIDFDSLTSLKNKLMSYIGFFDQDTIPLIWMLNAELEKINENKKVEITIVKSIRRAMESAPIASYPIFADVFSTLFSLKGKKEEFENRVKRTSDINVDADNSETIFKDFFFLNNLNVLLAPDGVGKSWLASYLLIYNKTRFNRYSVILNLDSNPEENYVGLGENAYIIGIHEWEALRHEVFKKRQMNLHELYESFFQKKGNIYENIMSHYWTEDSEALADPSDVLLDFMENYGELVDYLVIDTLDTFLDGKQPRQSFYSKFIKLIREKKTTVLVLHHPNVNDDFKGRRALVEQAHGSYLLKVIKEESDIKLLELSKKKRRPKNPLRNAKLIMGRNVVQGIPTFEFLEDLPEDEQLDFNVTVQKREAADDITWNKLLLKFNEYPNGIIPRTDFVNFCPTFLGISPETGIDKLSRFKSKGLIMYAGGRNWNNGIQYIEKKEVKD